MSDGETPWLRIVGIALVVALAIGVIVLVHGSGQAPDEVSAIDWNRQPCAHCQMLIGDPHHAAQLVTEDGEVLSFDDPGCALGYLDDHHPTIHRLWFHHATADRWIGRGDVAFTTGGTTPMGSGLLAVDRGLPNTLDLASAHRHAAHDRGREAVR